MRWSCGLASLVGVAVLAFLAWTRLSDDALSLIVGLLIGVAVSAPAWVLALISMRRQRRPVEEAEAPLRRRPSPWPHGQPPVVIISPGNNNGASWGPSPISNRSLPFSVDEYPGQRSRTHIVGDEDDDFIEGDWRG